MLRHFFFLQLSEFQGYNSATWFQQDGATCHTSNESLADLKEKFAGKLVSRRGDIPWPPRSPDLTPLDFFLWGYMKSRVYSNNPTSIAQLKANIHGEMAAIPRAMCERVFGNLKTRFEKCLQRDGAHLDDVIFKK
ncbi:Transposable element Tc3 transposase [Papilio machaon]|uniref:Transposable element Tc3 transposase n=1 Tax=Papilio machaon TaxID=76193 RepID=A0A0N1IEU7_PAPMA|nr:Transposable element Tc3 transposase [Papilio machaon]